MNILFISCRKYPELYKWFKDFLGYKEAGGTTEAVPQGAMGKERVTGDLAMEIGRYDVVHCRIYYMLHLFGKVSMLMNVLPIESIFSAPAL